MFTQLEALTDEELARQSQAGSLPAFETLVSRFERRIYSFVAHCCGNAFDAREITQDAFVQAFQAIALYDPRRPFAAWLFTIARRKCIDRYRAAARPIAEEPPPEVPDLEDPAEMLARREDRRGLWEWARALLGELEFQALWLRYAEDLDIAEIAPILGKSRTHVKVLLFRVRQKLGRELDSATERLRPPEWYLGLAPEGPRVLQAVAARAETPRKPLRHLDLSLAGRKGTQ